MQPNPRGQVAAGLPIPDGDQVRSNSAGAVLEPSFDAFRRFCELSERLGADRALVQGAGGNTSIKHDGVLWVKASGTWLARSLDRPIFVPIDLPRIKSLVRSGAPDPITPAGLPGGGSLRASIETTLHALLDHDVVLHAHSVATIALAVRKDAERLLGPLLRGLSWAFVPYARPGLPLTRAVMDAIGDGTPPDLLVLANHGLVVGGPDCAAAEHILMEVERRLSAEARPARAPDLERLQALIEGSDYRLPADESCHAIATDPHNLAIAGGGSLYPDHVVFLGAGMTVVEPEQDLSRFTDHDSPPTFIAIRGVGVVVRKNLPMAAEVMIGCLADVVRLIPEGAAVTYLSFADEAELLDWDAEKLRQAMNGRG